MWWRRSLKAELKNKNNYDDPDHEIQIENPK